jgi:hypothetical protein
VIILTNIEASQPPHLPITKSTKPTQKSAIRSSGLVLTYTCQIPGISYRQTSPNGAWLPERHAQSGCWSEPTGGPHPRGHITWRWLLDFSGPTRVTKPGPPRTLFIIHSESLISNLILFCRIATRSVAGGDTLWSDTSSNAGPTTPERISFSLINSHTALTSSRHL